MTAPETDRVIEDFLAGRQEVVAMVAGWAREVARHRAWGFDSPDDIVQATLLGMVGNLRAGRFGGGDLRAYVRRIAKNLCVSSYRRARTRRGEVSLETQESEASVAPAAGLDAERRAALGRILALLDEACRRIIVLAYLHGQSRGEIAQRMGISEGAAKVRLFRCLEKARAL